MNIDLYEYFFPSIFVAGLWAVVNEELRKDHQDYQDIVGTIAKAVFTSSDLDYITPTYLSVGINKDAFFLNRLPPN